MGVLDWLNPASWVSSAVTAVGGKVADTVLGWHKDNLTAANNSERIKAELAQRVVAADQRESELNTEYKRAVIGRWYEPVQLLGYIMVFYVAKVVVWDKVFASMTGGRTDSIEGAVGEWAGAIIMFLIGKRGAENIARILRG